MRCPFCGFEESKVIDSRPTDEGEKIRRRRECIKCAKRFTTYEIIENVPIVVVKKDKTREVFDRSKLIKGMLTACEKRPVSLKDIEKRALERAPKKKTIYKDIQAYIEEKYGFKVHTAYIAEVKRDLGLPMYDAPNAVEELKRPRSHPTAEMVEAIKDALKHFEIIQ